MNNIKLYLVAVLFLSVFGACSNDPGADKKEIVVEAPKNVNETLLLHDFIQKRADVINDKTAPHLVSADDVYFNLDNYLVIDIRSHDAYVDGHINGAVHVPKSELLHYMATEANAGNYEKVVIACYTGQTASFYASLLRLLGYGNVHPLKWGMAGWSKKIQPNKWLKNISNEFASKVETKSNPKAPKAKYPEIKTGETSRYKILKARVQKVGDAGTKPVFVKFKDVKDHLSDYYIINYWPMDKYLMGHLPGAVQYTPKSSLSFDADLTTLPTDKPVLVYCFTGQHSSYVAAYLNVLGYDAKSLTYGANSFMNGKMKQGIGHAFSTDQINDYPVITGENPSNKKVVKTKTSVKNAPQKILPKKKKKKVEEEGGC